ncbi:hypothetical protein [Deinococcus navajonensis]|uniref:Uncharacterized protein n=1 Tax=Deinococcus navajonensis TaxID=309884 RepID=A0ABV8XHQ1_9DEIO
MYPITRETFPRTGIIEIPCYSAASYDGDTAILQPEGVTTPVDFSQLTQEEFESATHDQGRDVMVRGLAALETRWLLGLPEVTFRPPYRKPLGVRLEGSWYYAWPLRWHGTLDGGEYTVVRLSN